MPFSAAGSQEQGMEYKEKNSEKSHITVIAEQDIETEGPLYPFDPGCQKNLQHKDQVSGQSETFAHFTESTGRTLARDRGHDDGY
jgi:hypothetical protein